MQPTRIAAAALAAISLSPVALLAQAGQIETAETEPPLDRAAGSAVALTSPAGQPRSYAPLSPGDDDLGEQLLLYRADQYRPLRLHGGTEGHWTSNASLVDDGERDDFFWRFAAGADFVPHLTGNLYADLGANYGWFRYDSLAELDFEALDARAGLLHVFRDAGDLSVFARYRFTHLTGSGGAGGTLFEDHALELGAYRPVPLWRDGAGYLAWVSSFALDADPDYARRDEHSLLAGYRHLFTDRLSAGAYYRFSVHDYRGRTDLNHQLGAHLDFRLNALAALRASAGYRLNDSDLAGADYQAFSAGANLGVAIEF